MRIGSLFSGIGGLELGLEWAGVGHTVWQVEQNPYCLDVLARHWPEAERYTDVRTVGAANLGSVDLICGGFPCQDVSAAGKGAGLAGARSGLWFEYRRIVAELRPRWVVVENVASGAKRWVDQVCASLGEFGYSTLPIPLEASDLGAPHARARIFIVGVTTYTHAFERLAAEELYAPHADRQLLRFESRRASGAHGADSSEPARSRPDPDGLWGLQPSGSQQNVGRWPCDAGRIWTVEPDVARVVHGLPGRVDREKALGNSVVPQCAEVVGHVIQQLRAAFGQ